MKVLKTIGIILLVVLFPIGILYCIGKALFGDKRNFVTYLGMFFIFAAGFCLCAGLFWHDLPWMVTAVEWVKNILPW